MRLKPKLKGALLTLICIALILVVAWIYVGIRFRIWTPIEYGRFVELTVNLPVAQKLWFGEIKAGDDAERLIKDWHPHMVTRYGRWVDMVWYPGGPKEDVISLVGISIVARDGVLVQADSYADDGIDQKVFFNSLKPADEAEQRTALKEYIDKKRAEQEKSDIANTNQPSAEIVH